MKRIHVFLIVCIIFLSIIFCLPLILPLNTIVVEESYLQFSSLVELNLSHFARDHRIPLWAFHFGGGYPFIKHPDNISLSPLFYLLMVPFGSANGLKLFLIFSYSVAVVGFFLFVSRILQYNLLGSTITTMFFVFNSFIPFQINTGNVKDQSWFYLPFITYTLFASKKDRRFIFYCALCIVLVLFNGFSLYLAPLLLFLLILVMLDTVPPSENRILNNRIVLNNFFIILFLTFLLGAIKIFPLLELLRMNSRGINEYMMAAGGSMTFRKMILALLSRGPYAVGNEAIMGPNGLGMGSVMYFGIVPMTFFFLSCIFCVKKVWKYLVIVIIFIFLSMAGNSPIDLFYILWHFPLFHSMHQVARYFCFPVVFMIAVIAGSLFSSQWFINRNKKLKFIVYILAFIGIVDLFIANTKYYAFAGSYQGDIPTIERRGDFFNVESIPSNPIKDEPFYNPDKLWDSPQYRVELPDGIQYYLLKHNVGLINWNGTIKLEENAVPKYKVTIGYGDYWKNFRDDLSEDNGIIKNKKYRGECYFVRYPANKVKRIEWGTNRIVIDVEQPYPDRLIVNQNYDKEWISNVGTTHDAHGLLGIELKRPVEGEVTLYYRPVSFYVGMIVSIATLVFCFIILYIVPYVKRNNLRSQKFPIFSQ